MTDDETVLVSPKPYRTTGKNTTRKYHTHNCRYVTEDFKEKSKADLDRRGFEECGFCADKVDQSNNCGALKP